MWKIVLIGLAYIALVYIFMSLFRVNKGDQLDG